MVIPCLLDVADNEALCHVLDMVVDQAQIVFHDDLLDFDHHEAVLHGIGGKKVPKSTIGLTFPLPICDM
jgi:hypothetical protein